MKALVYFLLLLSVLFCCCQQKEVPGLLKGDEYRSIVIDSSFRDAVKAKVVLVSDRYFSSFKTPLQATFYSDGHLDDSISDDNFEMISWYSIHQDTTDLVAHIGVLQTVALLVRFINGKPVVFFYRAPHDVKSSNYFKINTPVVFYAMKLSRGKDGGQIRHDFFKVSSNPDFQ